MQPRAFYALELPCNGQKNILPRATEFWVCDLIFVKDLELIYIIGKIAYWAETDQFPAGRVSLIV